MRSMAPILIACSLLALSGCAEVPYPEDDTLPADSTDGNRTVEPAPPESVEVVEVAAAAPAYPHVTSVVTAPYTAPVEIVLAEEEGEHGVMRLVAGPEGLRCESESSHGLGAPSGYKVAGAWTRCSLSTGLDTFAQGRANGMDAALHMMDEVPVDSFTWNMTVGRILVNNTGSHDERLGSVDRTMEAGPSVGAMHSIDGQDLLFYYPHSVCDTLLQGGWADVQLFGFADRGQAHMVADLTGFDVMHVNGLGPQVDAANASALEGAGWWIDGDMFHAQGDWGEQSVAQLNLTIDFEGQGTMLAIIPPPECPDALFVDFQEIPIEASAKGIAAGWLESDDFHAPFEVWHTT